MFLRRLCSLLICCLAAAGRCESGGPSAQPVSVSVETRFDPNPVPLNRETVLTVTVRWRGAADDVEVEDPKDPMLKNLTIVGKGAGNEVSAGECRRTYTYRLRPDSMGMAYHEPMEVEYRLRGEQETRTLRAPQNEVEVVEPAVEGLPPAVRAGGLAAVAVLLVVVILFGVRALRRRAPEPVEAEEAPPSPGEDALEQLRRHTDLRIRGEVKEYCAAVSATLRRFVEQELQIHARGLSTAELVERIAAAGVSESAVSDLRDALTRCDDVKFAGLTLDGAALDDLQEAAQRFVSEAEHRRRDEEEEG